MQVAAFLNLFWKSFLNHYSFLSTCACDQTVRELSRQFVILIWDCLISLTFADWNLSKHFLALSAFFQHLVSWAYPYHSWVRFEKLTLWNCNCQYWPTRYQDSCWISILFLWQSSLFLTSVYSPLNLVSLTATLVGGKSLEWHKTDALVSGHPAARQQSILSGLCQLLLFQIYPPIAWTACWRPVATPISSPRIHLKHSLFQLGSTSDRL